MALLNFQADAMWQQGFEKMRMTTHFLFSNNNYLVIDIFCQRSILCFIALVYSKQRTTKVKVDKLWPMSACSQTASELRLFSVVVVV